MSSLMVAEAVIRMVIMCRVDWYEPLKQRL